MKVNETWYQCSYCTNWVQVILENDENWNIINKYKCTNKRCDYFWKEQDSAR